MKLAELEQLQLHNIFLQKQLVQANMNLLRKDFLELENTLLTKSEEYQKIFEKVCEENKWNKETTTINPITGDVKVVEPEVKKEVENAV